MDIPLTELEQAINYWRARYPATGEEGRLSPAVAALAQAYALAIFEGRRQCPPESLDTAAREAFAAWRAQVSSRSG